MKRVFLGSVATETNTFSPLRTDLRDFRESFHAPPGQHPATPTLCSAIFPVARTRAHSYGWTLIEGTATWAEPGGLLHDGTWEFLRDRLLAELRAALPVDIVLLGLHGAMMTESEPDCEGDLLERVRAIAGPKAIIGATFDPHSHLSARRVAATDLVVAFKEFPHTDFVVAAERLVELAQRTAEGAVRPAISVFDVRMIDILPTNHDPMRNFVNGIIRREAAGEALSISVIHGFMAGDSPDLGAKIVVITDDAQEHGDRLARQLGEELFRFRGRFRPEFLDPEEALRRAAMQPKRPVVIADVWDNPGGGVPGDSTILTRMALDMDLDDIAVGTIWDPMAVRICHAAGAGARLSLRFGAKTSASAGDPIDAEVQVTWLSRDAVQRFGDSVVPLGDSAAIRLNGIEIVLNSNRSQSFSPDLFSNMGIDPLSKRILIVKSTNHFHGAFAPIASTVLYAAVDGLYPSRPEETPYRRLARPIWPIVNDPHGSAD